jgi:MMP 1-O-methyltransferase
LLIDKLNINNIKGFLDEKEAICLYDLALISSSKGPCLEIGSYCGKSAAYIGSACRKTRSILFSLDHHNGSEEQQPGEAYFDSELLDKETGKIDTLKFFRKTISDYNLENSVIPIIGRSEIVGKYWQTPLSLIFIDGSHAYESVLNDFNIWSKHLIKGGYLIFHDIFPDPEKGGQAPYLVYQMAAASNLYEQLPMCESLGILKYR